jgi:RHS repeat-associated protein
MPGSYGYTGQRADAATGLDYYNARYYDAVAWQFASADSMQDGLNRYAYVGGNPETASDPTGHISVCDHCDVDLDPPPNPSPQPAPTPGPSKGQQPPSNKTSGASTTTTITSLCDEKCRDDRSAGMGDFWKGLGGSVGLLALMAGSCAFGPACAGVMHVLLPMLLQTLHIMLDGLDLLDRAAGGSVGDWLSLFVRGAKVAIDVLQVIIGISDVFDIFEKVTSAWKGFKALGSFLRDVFSQESSALAKDAGTTAAALLGFSNDITQDLTDLNESVEAFALAHGAAA